MKKVIAIFLLLQIVSNNTFAEELLKMPKLFTHFYHHAREHKDGANFFYFLHQHYADHHKNDHHEKGHRAEDNDCDLPFKHCGHGLGIHAPALGFIPSYLDTDWLYFSFTASDFTNADDRIESQDLCSIWQPPKLG